MPRVRLNELQEYRFRYAVRLQLRDINHAGHMGNDTLVSLLGAAQAEMFHSLGLSEIDLGDGRTGIIVSDMVVNYKAEGFMFDELLIDTHAAEFGRTGFRLFHRVTRGETLVALAEKGLTIFDYTSRRVAPIPEVLLRFLVEPKG
jgi:acyl-CoA thioester hydrolase